MVHYFFHINVYGVRIEDALGFDADGHDEAVAIAKAICAILLHRERVAAEAMVELVTHNSETVLMSSLSALLADFH